MSKNVTIIVAFAIAVVAVIWIYGAYLQYRHQDAYVIKTDSGTITIPTDSSNAPVTINGESLDDRTNRLLESNGF